jgi:hypothetical protein
VVLWSSPFVCIGSSSANLVLWSCGPFHLEIEYTYVQILFCGPVVLSIWRYNTLKCKSCFVLLWSSPFGDIISSSANLFYGPVVLSIWRYNKLKCKSSFMVLWTSPFADIICLSANILCVVLRSSSFGDKICSSANLVLW